MNWFRIQNIFWMMLVAVVVLPSVSAYSYSLRGEMRSYYLDDNTSGTKNITRELVNQLINNANSRTRFNASNLSTYAVSGQTGVYKVPVIAGDSISYALTINPHANQDTNVNTGTSTSSRKFLVKLVIQ